MENTKKICPTCKGSGVIEKTISGGDDFRASRDAEVVCDDCEGTGKVDQDFEGDD